MELAGKAHSVPSAYRTHGTPTPRRASGSLSLSMPALLLLAAFGCRSSVDRDAGHGGSLPFPLLLTLSPRSRLRLLRRPSGAVHWRPSVQAAFGISSRLSRTRRWTPCTRRSPGDFTSGCSTTGASSTINPLSRRRVTTPSRPTSPTSPVPIPRRRRGEQPTPDNCEIRLAARLVELSPGVLALLVTQEGGQDEVYQDHWLLLEQKGKLETLWYSETGPGHDSRVRVLPTGAQQSDVAFIDASRTSDKEPNALDASRVHFDRASGLKNTPLPDVRTPLFVANLGTFKTSDAAFKTWVEYRPCSFHYRVFKANLFSGVRARGFVPGHRSCPTEDVKAEKSALSKCAGVPTPSILEFHRSR